MPELSQEFKNAINTLSNKDWVLIEKKLLLHAAVKVRYTAKRTLRIWNGMPSSQLPEEELNDMAKDFVAEARYKLLSGERTWVPQAPIVNSLLRHLMGSIDGLISNATMSQPNKVRQDRSLSPLDDNDEAGNTHIERIVDESATPEEALIAEQEKMRELKWVEEFQQLLKEDGETIAVQMIELGKDYIFKPSVVADKIGCSSQALRKAKKRATRQLRAFLKEKGQLRR